MGSVVAVSKCLAVHSVLALPQCVIGWLNLKRKWPSTKTCFVFDRGGEVCNAATCRYTHTCRRCGGPYSAAWCYRQQTQPNPARPTSATGNPAAQLDCQFATSRFQEIVCLPQSLLTHSDMSLSVTIIILLRIFSMAFNTVSELAALAQQVKGVTNLKSAVEFPAVMYNKISKELALGRILVPFDAPPPSDPTYPTQRVPL